MMYRLYELKKRMDQMEEVAGQDHHRKRRRTGTWGPLPPNDDD